MYKLAAPVEERNADNKIACFCDLRLSVQLEVPLLNPLHTFNWQLSFNCTKQSKHRQRPERQVTSCSDTLESLKSLGIHSEEDVQAFSIALCSILNLFSSLVMK